MNAQNLLMNAWAAMTSAGFDCRLLEEKPGTVWHDLVNEIPERLHVFSGQLEVQIEGKKWNLGPGAWLDIPAGARHGSQVLSQAPVQLLYGFPTASGSSQKTDMPQPVLTADDLAFFEDRGYFILEDAVPLPQIEAWQQAARELVAKSSGVRAFHERVLFRHPSFRELFHLSRLLGAVECLLGSDLQLLALDLLLTSPGFRSTTWHSDVSFHCNKTLSINTGLYLQDLNEEVGCLGVIPGSHRWGRRPNPEEEKAGHSSAEWLSPRAGSAVFFDAGLWHAGGQNQSQENRLGLFAYFGRSFIKRMDGHFTQPLPASLSASMDPRTRQLLGLGLRPGVKSYHGDDPGYNARGEPGVDF